MQESNKELNWGKVSSFEQYYTQWDLSHIIQAAINTETSIRNHIVRDNPQLSGYTLKELLSLPEEARYDVNANLTKGLDKMVEEVVKRLVDSGLVEYKVIQQLQSSIGYQELYTNIQKGDKYSTPHELIKGLQDLALAKKLGYDGVDVTYAGSERIDRDITLEFYKTHKNTTKKWAAGDRYSITTAIADEVKSNISNFSIGGHQSDREVFKTLLEGGKYRLKELNKSEQGRFKQIAIYTISTQKLESAVCYLIYNKYGGADGDYPHFNAPVFFSSNTEIRLLSDMLLELQTDLNQGGGESDTIIKFFYELTKKNQLRGTIRYGYRNKK